MNIKNETEAVQRRHFKGLLRRCLGRKGHYGCVKLLISLELIAVSFLLVVSQLIFYILETQRHEGTEILTCLVSSCLCASVFYIYFKPGYHLSFIKFLCLLCSIVFVVLHKYLVTLLIIKTEPLIRFILNEKDVATNLPAGTVLLDFIRYQQQLMGTKIGCREGDCGACTILVGEIKDNRLQYQSMTSCLLPLGNVQGKHIVSIEGINPAAGELNPIQQAMAEEGATQCGFCTPGFVVSLAGFCLNDIEATKENAIAAIDGNICRCTGYKSIERAAAKLAIMMKERNGEEVATFVTKNKILPFYFSTIKNRLQTILNGQFTTHDSRPDSYRDTIVGGGTDLYVQKHDEMTHADIRFVFNNAAFNGITREGNKCIIGPSATVTDLKDSPVINKTFPDFHRYAKLVSSTPIRNMATIAGNFINASPIGDFTIFFLALDTQISLLHELRSQPSPGSVASEGGGLRTLPLRKLYKGYKQLDKLPDEIISKIWFELPGKNSLFNFEKVSKRTNLDIATVNSAISIAMNEDIIESASIAAGGVGPVPMYLQKTSAFLNGKNITEELIFEAIEIAQTEISPISDARGTKEYKTILLGQLIKAHFITLFPGIKLSKLINT